MAHYVVDSSVAAKWFLIEEYAEAAWRLRLMGSALHVPEFFFLEFGQVVCKKHRRREIRLNEGIQMIHDVRRVPIQRHNDGALFTAALRYALEARAGLYDCLYLSLALQLDCEFVTADRRFIRTLSETEYADHVLWIEDLPAG